MKSKCATDEGCQLNQQDKKVSNSELVTGPLPKLRSPWIVLPPSRFALYYVGRFAYLQVERFARYPITLTWKILEFYSQNSKVTIVFIHLHLMLLCFCSEL